SVEVVTLPGVGGPLVVPGCRLVAIYRQEVPSLKDGQLLFIATEPGPSEEIPDDRLVEVDVRFQVVPVKAGDKVPGAEVITLPGGSRRYRLVKEGESVDAVDLLIIQQHKRLRRLTVGDKVKEGQILALVDPRMALAELASKKAKVIASRADHDASAKTAGEARSRYDTQVVLYNSRAGRATSREDVDGARLTWERYVSEAISKEQAITLATEEMNQAQTALEMQIIRSKINGVIKAIYKNRGDAVKNLESVLLIQDPDWLRIEGLVELQHARYLEPGMDVVVEPS